MCMSLQRVIIQLEDPMASARVRSAPPFFTSDIAIVHSVRAPGEGFSLHGRGKPAWDLPNVPSPEWCALLTAEETERLLALLGEIAVPFAPPRLAGFDGSWHILEIASGAHSIRLEWWVDLPSGWESVGAVYDHAVSLARRTYLAWLQEAGD